jgi:predicted nuclease with TOPRIM domain
LNKQFDSLLQTLPEGKLEDDNTSGEKRVSKAEVLIWAQRHIKELEKDKAKLVEEKEGLVGNVDSLRRQWVCLDEGCVP